MFFFCLTSKPLSIVIIRVIIARLYPPRKTLALNLCKTPASLARRITPAALRLSASAQFLRLYYPYFLPVSTVIPAHKLLSQNYA